MWISQIWALENSCKKLQHRSGIQMKKPYLLLSIFLVMPAVAQKNDSSDRLRQDGSNLVTVDQFGVVQHNRPKFVVEKNCLVPTDMFGEKQLNKEKICLSEKK